MQGCNPCICVWGGYAYVYMRMSSICSFCRPEGSEDCLHQEKKALRAPFFHTLVNKVKPHNHRGMLFIASITTGQKGRGRASVLSCC